MFQNWRLRFTAFELCSVDGNHLIEYIWKKLFVTLNNSLYQVTQCKKTGVLNSHLAYENILSYNNQQSVLQKYKKLAVALDQLFS